MEMHDPGCELVFVYGSLKRGGHNHYLLQTSVCMGEWRTRELFSLYDLGPFPAVCLEGGSRISGEVYQVSPGTMADLDALEGYPGWYQRTQIDTCYGRAWIYYLQSAPADGVLIDCGEWRPAQAVAG
ncbi:MAG: gamma-glutamylcyclotransferase [Gammaproteobacteria bacterium]|uniref:gamma-glutamylcyclotransferase family protein n=1 Tax=Pseudomaricurvus alcaniphilus TaxID=1166482 RepID=UPI00140CFAE1|nr:gamma-glutamylcyclotransferase family protein [Pseudomaricurvus alcaniphilus]MBR9909640.1 gamma-glutamylcyclotransferase [Gammaproteobacteria bacterium]NHN36944.1 gamma-glutamylcyclotransferase [Pseudomaricurvus alcaniphilus]